MDIAKVRNDNIHLICENLVAARLLRCGEVADEMMRLREFNHAQLAEILVESAKQRMDYLKKLAVIGMN